MKRVREKEEELGGGGGGGSGGGGNIAWRDQNGHYKVKVLVPNNVSRPALLLFHAAT